MSKIQETIPDITKDARVNMEKALESSKRELGSIRSGKASPSMLDTIRVEAYGSQVPLSQVASVSAPEPPPLLPVPPDGVWMSRLGATTR